MKKLDLVKLKQNKPSIKYNLILGMHGIIVKLNDDNADVLFFNPQNIGDYAIVNVKLQHLILEKEKLPKNFEKEFISNIDNILSKSKKSFKAININAFDLVELIVDDEKYTKFGIHKGDRGCVMENNAVQNYIEVDFSGIDKNGNYYGDCISVKIDDLKIIN